jgi:hypothetical protein
MKLQQSLELMLINLKLKNNMKIEFFEKQVSDNVWHRYITGIAKVPEVKQEVKTSVSIK